MTRPTVPYAVGRENDPAMAAEQHVNDTVAKHPVTGPTDLGKYRLFKVTDALISRLRMVQGELAEDGQEETVGFYRSAIEQLETARRRQAND